MTTKRITNSHIPSHTATLDQTTERDITTDFLYELTLS